MNLIGEHTDYNDGFVLPMALSMVTVVVGRKNDSVDNVCRVITLSEACDGERKAEFSCVGLCPDQERRPKWAEYVKGTVANFHQPLDQMSFDAIIASSVPLGKYHNA